jgi:hypothetical protein
MTPTTFIKILWDYLLNIVFAQCRTEILFFTLVIDWLQLDQVSWKLSNQVTSERYTGGATSSPHLQPETLQVEPTSFFYHVVHFSFTALPSSSTGNSTGGANFLLLPRGAFLFHCPSFPFRCTFHFSIISLKIRIRSALNLSCTWIFGYKNCNTL